MSTNIYFRWFWVYFQWLSISPLLLCILFAPTEGRAFKLKTHAIIGNISRDTVIAAETKIILDKIGATLFINDQELVNALRNYPTYFRAGVLGPDAFPDLIAGQTWVHVNNGNPEGRSDCASGASCKSGGVPFEERAFAEWRSIDYGMYMLREARAYRRGENSQEARDQRLQALAFAYGYLGHMIADGFAHSYVNEWARSVFNIRHNNPGALYGPPTEEIQHMAVEGFIDGHMPPVSRNGLEIDYPRAFLSALFTSPITVEDQTVAPAGSFAGPYIVGLVQFRRIFDILSHRENWSGAAGLPGWTQDLTNLALELNRINTQIATLGTDIGSPMRDFEDYFQRRRAMTDALLGQWVDLSGCIAQNLLRGANAGPGEIEATDDCQTIDFEPPPLDDIFRGSLNAAAHYGKGNGNIDYGRLAGNAEKISRYVTTVLERGLIFDPTEDIRSLRLIKRAIEECDIRLIDWDTCENACRKANELCVKLVTITACLTCPKKDGHPSCEGWRAVPCGLEPHCFACAEDWLEEVVDPACILVRNKAIAPCNFCSTNTICAHLSLAKTGVERGNAIMREIFTRVLEAAIEEVKRRAIETYAGPYVKDYLGLYREFERRRANAKPAWFVNLAFLREDLQDDPGHLNLVIARIVGLRGDVASNAASLAEAIATTFEATQQRGRDAVAAQVDTAPSTSEEDVWRGLIDVLYRMARDPNFDAPEDLNAPAFGWLDAIRYRTPGEEYDNRFAHFAALMAKLGGLTGIRGPTARALRRTLQLSDELEDVGATVVNVNSFHPVHNSIQLTKLSFLDEAGLRRLGELAGVAGGQSLGFVQQAFVGNRHQVSELCRSTPHIACDAIQSLDDPNHYGHRLANNSAWPGAQDVDPERSVTIWESRDSVPRDPASTGPACRQGLTNFLLAGHADTVMKIYDRIFLLPHYCRSMDLSWLAPLLGTDAVSLPWSPFLGEQPPPMPELSIILDNAE